MGNAEAVAVAEEEEEELELSLADMASWVVGCSTAATGSHPPLPSPRCDVQVAGVS